MRRRASWHGQGTGYCYPDENGIQDARTVYFRSTALPAVIQCGHTGILKSSTLVIGWPKARGETVSHVQKLNVEGRPPCGD